jgi:hypothetical protein
MVNEICPKSGRNLSTEEVEEGKMEEGKMEEGMKREKVLRVFSYIVLPR